MKKGNIFGIILILIGIAWLMRQTGIISINWAVSVKVLWPVFLVAAGITLLARRRNWLVTTVWILTFVLFIGFGIYKRNEPGRIFDIEKRFGIDKGPIVSVKKQPFTAEIPLPQDAEKGRLILQLGGVNLNLKEGNDSLFIKTGSNIPGLQQRLAEGKQTVLEYSHEQFNAGNAIRNMNLEMNPDLVWTVDANLGVVDGKMDFSNITVEDITLQLGAGEMALSIGDKQAYSKITLRAGASDIDIFVPSEAGLMVKSGNILTDLSFHNLSLTSKDGVYVSENYEKADHKIEIDVVSALSAVQIYGR
jgi:predicted membrane protein